MLDIINLPPAAAIYLLFLAAVTGACAGSFLYCAAMRRRTGEKLPRGRSHCMSCGHELGVRDLVPVFSWLFLRGRCRFCGARIPAKYPVTEGVLAALFMLASARFGLSLYTVETCLLFAALFYLSLVDLDTMELPNGALAFAAVLFLAFLPAHKEPLSRLLWGLGSALVFGGSLLAVSLVMDKVMKKETMGGGDIKLLAVLALFTGPGPALLLVILACVVGLFFAFGKKRGEPFPFGPSLALAAVPAVLWGENIVSWYLGLFVR